MGLSDSADAALKGFISGDTGRQLTAICVPLTGGIVLGWATTINNAVWFVCALPIIWVLLLLAVKVEPMIGKKKEVQVSKVLIPAGQPEAPKYPLAGTPDVSNLPISPERG